ncbi:MAG: hypothetical protein CFH41_01633 [Alphaproteobacteria bacterium MarineAlpha11_Bin1]|nr:MAG: hypothetical protein CFH41_01633 [Alphaproteobacteria bacterium MarineAlpha11_Bin1]|tara:strand:+ start:227 stop:2089 length:1863 start_codon:yes stop_codon:yes gene_type:complete
MEQLIVYFSPEPTQIAGLGAVLLVCAGLFFVGKLVRRQKEMPEINLVAGWSATILLFIIAGGFLQIDLRIVAAGLMLVAILSCGVALRRNGLNGSTDIFRSLVLTLPLLWLVSAMMISQWDEFTHWMPNARYLVSHHTLPGAGNPDPTSNLPGYPHALAFIVYLASSFTGELAENVSALFSIILMAFFAVTLGRIVSDSINGGQSDRKIGWTYCAIGALALTLFNPTFVPKIVFTAYADTPTMVLVGILTFLMWMILNSLSGVETRYSTTDLSWSFGLVGMAIVGTKQPNIVLFFLIVIGGLLVSLRDPHISLRSYLRLLPAIVLPAIIVYSAWRLHIEISHIEGEFNFLPPHAWMIDKIDVITGRMLSVASKKGGYFGIMMVACLFALKALWKLRTPFDRLSLIVATLFAGHICFLLFVYVTAFGGNGLVAPSFWRFNMHLGGACVIFGLVGTTLLWQKFVVSRINVNLSWLVIALILFAPAGLAYKIRFDLHPPSVFVREVSKQIVHIVPEGAPFVVLDVTGNGEFEVIVRYVTSPHVDYKGFFVSGYGPSVENLRRFTDEKKPQYIWVHVPTTEIQQALNVKLKPRHSYLLEMKDRQANVLNAWPFPGYDNPNKVPN